MGYFIVIPLVIIVISIPLYPKWSYKEYYKRSKTRCKENPSLLWSGKKL